MKLLADACRIDVRGPGGQLRSQPAFWHKLELGHDGSSRGAAASLPLLLAAGCWLLAVWTLGHWLPLASCVLSGGGGARAAPAAPRRAFPRCRPPAARPAGIWKKYGLLCAHDQVMARIKPHQVGAAAVRRGGCRGAGPPPRSVGSSGWQAIMALVAPGGRAGADGTAVAGSRLGGSRRQAMARAAQLDHVPPTPPRYRPADGGGVHAAVPAHAGTAGALAAQQPGGAPHAAQQR